MKEPTMEGAVKQLETPKQGMNMVQLEAGRDKVLEIVKTSKGPREKEAMKNLALWGKAMLDLKESSKTKETTPAAAPEKETDEMKDWNALMQEGGQSKPATEATLQTEDQATKAEAQPTAPEAPVQLSDLIKATEVDLEGERENLRTWEENENADNIKISKEKIKELEGKLRESLKKAILQERSNLKTWEQVKNENLIKLAKRAIETLQGKLKKIERPSVRLKIKNPATRAGKEPIPAQELVIEGVGVKTKIEEIRKTWEELQEKYFTALGEKSVSSNNLGDYIELMGGKVGPTNQSQYEKTCKTLRDEISAKEATVRGIKQTIEQMLSTIEPNKRDRQEGIPAILQEIIDEMTAIVDEKPKEDSKDTMPSAIKPAQVPNIETAQVSVETKLERVPISENQRRVFDAFNTWLKTSKTFEPSEFMNIVEVSGGEFSMVYREGGGNGFWLTDTPQGNPIKYYRVTLGNEHFFLPRVLDVQGKPGEFKFDSLESGAEEMFGHIPFIDPKDPEGKIQPIRIGREHNAWALSPLTTPILPTPEDERKRKAREALTEAEAEEAALLEELAKFERK